MILAHYDPTWMMAGLVAGLVLGIALLKRALRF